MRLERVAVLAALLAERKAVVAELEEETAQILAESTIQARALADHLVWRLAEAVAVLLVIGFLGGLVLVRLSRPRA